MARPLTKESLKKLKSSGSEAKDKFLQRVIWAIHKQEFKLHKEEDSIEEDEYGIEFECSAYYGDFKSIGVTIKQLKKPNGIYPRYYIQIETDEDSFEVGGEYGAKAWKVTTKATIAKEEINEDKLLDLLNELDD